MSKNTGGQKGRKIGRAKRKPTHNRYNSEGIRELNKERKRLKQEKNKQKREQKNNGIRSNTV